MMAAEPATGAIHRVLGNSEPDPRAVHAVR